MADAEVVIWPADHADEGSEYLTVAPRPDGGVVVDMERTGSLLELSRHEAKELAAALLAAAAHTAE